MPAGGTLTLAEMQSELRYALDNRTDLTTTQLTRWLQWTYLHVSQPDVFRHRELQATSSVVLVAGTYQYNVPDDLLAIYTLQHSTLGFKIRPRSYLYLQELSRHSGRPAYYALWGRQLVLFPTPTTADTGAVLNLAYWKRPPDLAAAGAASVLPPEWDEAIVEGAKWRAWRALNQPERAVEARENFAAVINDLSQLLRVDGEDQGFGVELEGLDNYMGRS